MGATNTKQGSIFGGVRKPYRSIRSASISIRDRAVRRGFARGRVPAYWYRGTPNLGDQLSPVITEWVTGARMVWVTKAYRGKVLGAGSILGALAEGDIVWGSGSIRDQPIQAPPDVDFLAVRGPLTRARIRGDVPEVYGDPALLLPRFHSPASTKKHPLGIVPHYVDRDALSLDDPEILVIDVRKPWEVVVSDIRSCELILSSSLHGLTVAEAYGIPSSWIRVTDRVVGGEFKFNDYYLSTGRDETRPSLWEEGIDRAVKRVAPPLVFDERPLLEAAAGLPTAEG